MGKWSSFIRDSAWTWGGAVIVLVTLSGWTRTIGLWITGGAFVLHLVGHLVSED